ncbi:hypothetical protein BT96DRAFT_999801 [Gymnopus androsaceus JB14]|uniref:Uncharacterized protein n=1 Tax=Gymnopus androsaceus JB14 TaxID=1447944 RepID=A0A6A4H5W1_9AGAR|nr:hypothetical protein BT96DRAFT_999801 [Gymnopus androsaceus JB14]
MANEGGTSVIREPPTFNIEHMPVVEDPRQWSDFRKSYLAPWSFDPLTILDFSRYAEMEADLPATPSQISLSLSFSGYVTVEAFWTLLTSLSGSSNQRSQMKEGSGCQEHRTIDCLSLFPSRWAKCHHVDAPTLADIFDPVERGTKHNLVYQAKLATGGIFEKQETRHENESTHDSEEIEWAAPVECGS